MAGFRARTDAGNKAALLLQILGNLVWLENNRGIEIGESKHQNKIKNAIHQKIIAEQADDEFRKLRQSRHSGSYKKLGHQSGHHNQRNGKDDGDDAGLIDPERQVALRPAHHGAAADEFGISNRNVALAFGDKNHARHGYQSDDHEDDDIDELGRIIG